MPIYAVGEISINLGPKELSFKLGDFIDYPKAYICPPKNQITNPLRNFLMGSLDLCKCAIASSSLTTDYCHEFLRPLHYTPETPPTHTWLSLEIFHHSLQCCLFLSIIETHSKRLPGCIRYGSDKIPKHRFLAPTPLAWHSEVVEATPVVNTFNSSDDIGEGEGRVCREGKRETRGTMSTRDGEDRS